MPALRRDCLSVLKKMSERPRLTIAISTVASRIKGINFPPSALEHELLVIVQNQEESSYLIEDRRAKLIELKNRGVAKSRNAAIERASGEFLLFSDDDITIEETGVQKALDYLVANPKCAIVLAQAKDETGALRKNYATQIAPLRLTNSARAATYEMIIRVDAIREAAIRFDERFGAGAELYLGDEYIFIADALRAGLGGVHLPVVIATHPSDSSGSRWGSEKDLTARAAVFTRVFGWQAPIYRFAFLLKNKQKFPGILPALRFIFKR